MKYSRTLRVEVLDFKEDIFDQLHRDAIQGHPAFYGIMSCFLKTKAQFACFTISGKTDVLFWFQSECHLDMSFIFFDFHVMETSGYVDVMLLGRQEEPTERTFDELLDHLEASLMQAGPTVWRIFWVR